MKTYEAYKDSGIEWIGKIPEHWDRLRIKSLVAIKVTDGPHETPEWKNEGVPFISAEAIRENIIDLNYKRGNISFQQHTEYCKKSKVLKGDILFCKSGSTTGKSAMVNTSEEFGIWSPLAIIRAHKEKINNFFMYHSIQSGWFRRQVETSWTFGTQPNIGMNALENLWLAVPPLKEQTNIANYLDHKTSQLDSLISKKEKLVELLQEERTAIINHAVTKGVDPNVPMKDSGIDWLGEIPEHWSVKKVGYVSKVIRGASPRPAGDPLLFNGNYMPWITVKEVTNAVGKYINYTETFLTEEGAKQTRILEPETLILSNSGATLGVPRITLIRGGINDGSVAFMNLIVARDYLYYFFTTHTKIYRDEVSGYGQPNLNTEIVKSTPIPFPPPNEQNQIIKYIELQLKRFEEILIKTEQEIELLKEYKTALISEVVTGKVDVRNEALN